MSVKQGHKPVTIRDVAAHAKVSAMTVSNVLSENKARQRNVSTETRERVLLAVRELGYHPNVNALALRRLQTNIIGFYSGYGYLNAENAFLAAFIGGLQLGCNEHGKDLLIHGTHRGSSVADIYAEVVNGKIDGLIIYAPSSDPLVEMLITSRLPVVALVDTIPLLPSVVVDDVQGGMLQAQLLAQKGHRRILYQSETHERDSCLSIERRWISFREAAHSLGMEIIVKPSPHQGNEKHVSEEAVRWLEADLQERPTVAVCWNDLAAYDLLEYCDRRGVRIPDELAVVGYDGVMSMRGMTRRLTTIRAPWPQVSSTGVSVLVKMLGGEEVPAETILPVALFEGDTA